MDDVNFLFGVLPIDKYGVDRLGSSSAINLYLTMHTGMERFQQSCLHLYYGWPNDGATTDKYSDRQRDYSIRTDHLE